MGEKPESDDFDEDDDDAELEGDDVDLERGTKELERVHRRGSGKDSTPAWRRLELRMEEKRTAELTSDFADYNLDEPRKAARAPR